MPIARMNDCAGQINVKEFLRMAAKEKVKKLYKESPLVRETVEEFRKLRSSHFNTSPLDIIQLAG